MLRDLTTGRTTALTQDWDRSVTSIDWAHDSRSLYAIALDTQETPLWRIDARSGKVTRLTDNGTVSSLAVPASGARSEEHTSELQSLMRISYAVFCLNKKITN